VVLSYQEPELRLWGRRVFEVGEVLQHLTRCRFRTGG
jgi:hypothetical protein